MGKLMCEQMHALPAAQIMLPCAKNNVGAGSISPRSDGMCGERGLVIRMDPYATEIMPKPSLHKRARRRIHRLAGGAQDFINQGRRCSPFVVVPVCGQR